MNSIVVSIVKRHACNIRAVEYSAAVRHARLSLRDYFSFSLSLAPIHSCARTRFRGMDVIPWVDSQSSRLRVNTLSSIVRIRIIHRLYDTIFSHLSNLY